MRRETAIEAMDALVAQGYGVSLAAAPMDGMVGPGIENGVRYQVHLEVLSVGTVDLRALIETADHLGLEVGYSPMTGGQLALKDPDGTPAVLARRRHPVPTARAEQ